jgi:hypothetical protein
MAGIYFDVTDAFKAEWLAALDQAKKIEGRFVSQGDILVPMMKKFIEKQKPKRRRA